MEERRSLLALIAKMRARGDAAQIATLYDPEEMNNDCSDQFRQP